MFTRILFTRLEPNGKLFSSFYLSFSNATLVSVMLFDLVVNRSMLVQDISEAHLTATLSLNASDQNLAKVDFMQIPNFLYNAKLDTKVYFVLIEWLIRKRNMRKTSSLYEANVQT